jgi:hypothetical protein
MLRRMTSMEEGVKLEYWVYGSILLRLGEPFRSFSEREHELKWNSMYVKSIAVLAQVLCIVSLGPLADSCKLFRHSVQMILKR